jgi:hypothetical protein
MEQFTITCSHSQDRENIGQAQSGSGGNWVSVWAIASFEVMYLQYCYNFVTILGHRCAALAYLVGPSHVSLPFLPCLIRVPAEAMNGES